MKEISPHIYLGKFEAFFKWFQNNVHIIPIELYDYKIIDLKNSHLKLVDIVLKERKRQDYRVIIKVVSGRIPKNFIPMKKFDDIIHFNTMPFFNGTWQICYIALDEQNNPIGGVLFTFDGEKYHRFELE